MRWFAQIAFQVKSLFSKRKLDEQLSEEIRTHVEMATEANVAAGMGPKEARYAALREFGNVTQVQERARDEHGWVWLEQGIQDLRYAARQLGRSPGFTVLAILSLGLGIGAITSIYSVVDRAVLNPVPGRAPDQLMQIGEVTVMKNKTTPDFLGVSPPVFNALEAQRNFFADFTWHDFIALERKEEDYFVSVEGAMVGENFFGFLDARPVLGRGFVAGEATPYRGSGLVRDASIVISHAWWQTQFGGDSSVLGKTIELSGKHFTVVGVMPPHFQYPSPRTQCWLPGEPLRPVPGQYRVPNTKILVRLKAETPPEQLSAMLGTITGRLMQDNKDEAKSSYGSMWRTRPEGLKLWSLPLRFALQKNWGYADLSQTLMGFLAAAGFILLIVCANTANFTLARTERRRHELAIRAAVGAGKSRLIRQLLTENLLLAIVGGVVGLLVTIVGMRLLVSLSALPRLRPVEVDGFAFTVNMTAALLTGLVFGTVPALWGGRVQASDRLKQGGAGMSASRLANRYRGALVVFEIAIAVVLISGAGLMIRLVDRMLSIDPGFDAAHLISVQGSLFAGQFRGSTQDLMSRRNASVSQLREKFAALPGVEAVGVFKDSFQPEKLDLGESTASVIVNGAYSGVEELDFFRTSRVPLLAGRYFTREDIGASTQAVLVNESMAKLCWPGLDAVGRTFRALDREGSPVYQVVGVCGNAGLNVLGEKVRAVFFRPFSEAPLSGMPDQLLVRTGNDPAAAIPLIRRELTAFSSGMLRQTITVMQQKLYDTTLGQRTYRNYLTIFAGIGLFLAAMGVYGVLAYSVAQRTREIGIRLAIGAAPQSILRLIVGEGARLIVVGVTVGIIATLWLTKLLQKQFYGAQPNDPMVWLGALLILSAVGMLACWLPARRAAKVDPMVALRAE